MHPRAKQLRQIARGNQNKHFWWAVLITLLATLLAGDFASGVNLSFNLGDSSFDLYNGAYAVDDAMSGLRDFFLNPLVSALAAWRALSPCWRRFYKEKIPQSPAFSRWKLRYFVAFFDQPSKLFFSLSKKDFRFGWTASLAPASN